MSAPRLASIAAADRLHFVGIGGAGMSGIAYVLLHRGYRVTGCDLRDSPAVGRLRHLGAAVALGHDPAHVEDADILVLSRAVRDTVEEVRAARARGRRIVHRAEVLGEILRAGRGVAVVGTHGKTTTTAMLARIMIAGGADPTVLVGADVPELGGNARDGAGPWVVAEVDESDGSLLHTSPWGLVLTSLDITDHRDYYATASHLEETFARFLRAVPADGFVVACADHPRVGALLDDLDRRAVTYGFDDRANVRAVHVEARGRAVRAAVEIDGRPAGTLALQVPGRYNVANALGALAAARQAGIPVETALEALAGYGGATRRFEVRGDVDGVLIVDDYAHNPVKVAAVLRAAREGWPGWRVVALFQPHRYTRTQTTYADYARAFDDADEVIVTDIYPADETPLPGITARLIVDAVAAHRPVHYRPTLEDAAALAFDLLRPRTLVLTMGAGDVGRAGHLLVDRLTGRAGAARPRRTP